MASALIGLVFKASLVLLAVVGAASYKLYAKEVVSPYTLNRTNFCPYDVSNFADVLTLFEGKDILVAIDITTNPFYFGYNTTSFAPSGLMFDILTEIESRGGMQFVYAYVPHILTVTDSRLKVYVSHTDIVADTWWTDTPIRRKEGLGFTQAVVDSSLVFITTIEPAKTPFDPWAFLQPYSNTMWLCLAAFILIHSILLWGVESKFSWKEGDEGQNIFSYVYFSISALTGTGDPEASHPSGVFLNMGFFFFMMIFAAGYTADLAQILLTPPTSTIKYASLADANNQGAYICVAAGSAAQSYFATASGYGNIVWDATSVNASVVMQRVASGDCDGGIFGNIDWESLSVLNANNPTCNLVQAGGTIAALGGAFTYLPDDLSNCTSLVQRVIDYYIIDMKNDGTLDNIITSDIFNVLNLQCSSGGDDGSGSSQLSLQDLAGVFFVYLIALGGAIAAFAFKHGVMKEPFFTDDEASEHGSEVSKHSTSSATRRNQAQNQQQHHQNIPAKTKTRPEGPNIVELTNLHNDYQPANSSDEDGLNSRFIDE